MGHGLGAVPAGGGRRLTDVALREIHHGRVWRANACRVVEERDGLVVLWSPRGSQRVIPVDPDGTEVRIPRPEWTLATLRTTQDSLALLPAGEPWSLWLYWTEDGAFSHWYVNLERLLGRSAVGWDYVDHKLDLVVSPDGAVRWKDEDELAAAAAAGLLDEAEIRAQAERVVAEPPWPTGREGWRPDPSWPRPELPDGWLDAAPAGA